jgi:hypothetical protein
VGRWRDRLLDRLSGSAVPFGASQPQLQTLQREVDGTAGSTHKPAVAITPADTRVAAPHSRDLLARMHSATEQAERLVQAARAAQAAARAAVGSAAPVIGGPLPSLQAAPAVTYDSPLLAPAPAPAPYPSRSASLTASGWAAHRAQREAAVRPPGITRAQARDIASVAGYRTARPLPL